MAYRGINGIYLFPSSQTWQIYLLSFVFFFSLLFPSSPKLNAFAKLERERGHSTSLDKFLCNCGVKIEKDNIYCRKFFV